MEMIHKIREEHYKNTKKKNQKDIEESIKKVAKNLISKIGLKYADFENLK
jgi:hypothetical protein